MSQTLPKLYVILAADTEDNYPSYVPGWWRYGSDYDTDPPKLRFDWLSHLDELLTCFDIGGLRFKVTWFLRTDPSVGARCLNAMTNLIGEAKDAGDEMAIHIHTFRRDARSRLMQCLEQDACKATVSESLGIFKGKMGEVPKSARMGWNYMNNAIMQQLENDGVMYDASCIPGVRSNLMYGLRDNFSDWSRAPDSPYNPSYNDYQMPGTMKILEIPITTYRNGDVTTRNVFPNWIRTVSTLRRMTSIGATVSQFPLFHPARRFLLNNEFLIFSAWRSSADIDRLLSAKLSESTSTGFAYIHGYFHPSELLNPLNGKPNAQYLRNLRNALARIEAMQGQVEVVPVTMSEFGHIYATFQHQGTTSYESV